MRDRASSLLETRDVALIGYDEINRLAKERGKTVSDLIALTFHNDPFYAEQAGRVVAAKWFAEQYEREKFKAGVHVRRIHYRLISREGQKDWRGKDYMNTTACWQALLAASKDARYLGTVPLADFDDRRNPTAIATGVDLPRDPKLNPANVDASGLNLGDLVLPSLYINAADRPAQPYHCEIWCEKSTMRDILDLIGARYGVTRVYSLGEISLTGCIKLILGRVARNAAARKIEWLIKKNNLDIDLQLIPILLDKEQCIHYGLPSTPLKEGEARADEWAIRHGEGGTELDALEALHPGELHRIVTEALDRYNDHDLQGRWNALLIERRRAIGAIAADVRREYAAALSPYRAERDRLAWEANDLRQKVRLVFAKMIADISDRTGDDILDPLLEFVSEREIVEHPDPLFDSTRDYEEQIARYKLFQAKDEAFDVRRRAKRASKERARRAHKKAKRAAGMPETRDEEGGGHD